MIMHWRAFLTLVLIVAIIGLVTFSNSTKTLFKIPNIGLFTKEKEIQNTIFPVFVTTNKEALYGYGFDINNGIFNSENVCLYINLNGATLKKDGSWRCTVAIQNFTGHMSYTNIGTVKLVGQSDNIKVDDFLLDTPTHIDFELIPLYFIMDYISQEKIQFTLQNGYIEMFKNKSVEKITYLEPTPIDINNYVGIFELGDSGLVKLNGTATSVN